MNRPLIFRLFSFGKFKGPGMFSSFSCHGTVEMQLTTKEFVVIADVDYASVSCVGNPVTDYLKRYGHPIEQAVLFADGGYLLTSHAEHQTTIYAPSSNRNYAEISGDYNPIHVNAYFADYASLPGTITHGMWTSAAVRRFVETFAAENHVERVTGYIYFLCVFMFCLGMMCNLLAWFSLTIVLL